LENLVEALGLAGALLGERAPITGELPQIADLFRRDEARPDEPMLGELTDPLGVTDVGLVWNGLSSTRRGSLPAAF
jgi:hypothetical protein